MYPISSPSLLGKERTHDDFVNKNGSFDKVIKNIPLLEKSGISFSCYTVPMKSNFKEIPELIELLKSKGIKKFRILSLAPTGKAIGMWEKLKLSLDENKWLDEQLYELAQKLKIEIRVGFCSFRNFPKLLKLNGHEECYGWLNRCHIDANGNVFPCTASSGHINLSLGNVRDHNLNLLELWDKSSSLADLKPCKVINYFKKHNSSMLS